MNSKEQPVRSVRMIIESRLENVSLIGMSIHRLCSLIPFSETEAFKMELCAVEAVNNSIFHAYGKQEGFEIETIFELYPDRLVIQVLDAGVSMSEVLFREKALPVGEFNPSDIQRLPESGRGIGIIKSIMDHVSYRAENKKNCLTMVKKIHRDRD